jgi:hypothetical protein
VVHGSMPYEPSPNEYNDTVEIPLPTAGTPTTPLAALCVVCIVITFTHEVEQCSGECYGIGRQCLRLLLVVFGRPFPVTSIFFQ